MTNNIIFPLKAFTMYDKDIRLLLHKKLKKSSPHLINEVNLDGGKARIDVLDYSSGLTGFEIKSDHDSYARIPSQIKVYNTSLEYIYMVTTEKHKDNINLLIPAFWGLMIASEKGIKTIRKAQPNPHLINTKAICVLWKPELLKIVQRQEQKPGKFEFKRKAWLQRKVSSYFDIHQMCAIITEALRARTTWRNNE